MLSRTFSLLVFLSVAACGPTVSGDDIDSGLVIGDGTCDGVQTRCSGQTYQVCVEGEYVDQMTCPNTSACSADFGCTDCNPGFGDHCVGDSIYSCNADGSRGDLVTTCDFESCAGGVCTDACGAAEASRSYIGCEFWPVDLDNAVELLGPPLLFDCSLSYGPGTQEVTIPHCSDGMSSFGLCDADGSCAMGTCQTGRVCVFDAQNSPFAIVVSNPDPTEAVMVTIENSGGMTRTVSVAAGAVEAMYPQQLGFPDQSLDHTGLTNSAYKVTSNKPIVAYQFNPLDNADVFSNDGSLLIPRHAYDTKYYAVTLPTLTRRPNTNDYNGYVAIVAYTDTTIKVTPTANVRAGGTVAAMSAGATISFTLSAFEVLNLEAVADGDLTGTLIEADAGEAAFGVFVGHEANVLSNLNPSPCCADHIEEQLFPASAWGKEYAVARTKQRATEPDMLRIVAQNDGTTITFDPAPQGTCSTLNAGGHCDVFIQADTLVTSPQPILVAHFLLSTVEMGGNDQGDPAIALAIPFEQYRTSYTFLVPMQYDSQYISVVSPVGGTVLLDGVDISGQLTPFGGGAFIGGAVAVQPGQRKIECPEACGFEAYGYSSAVSYLFAGGLDLNQIVVD